MKKEEFNRNYFTLPGLFVQDVAGDENNWRKKNGKGIPLHYLAVSLNKSNFWQKGCEQSAEWAIAQVEETSSCGVSI